MHFNEFVAHTVAEERFKDVRRELEQERLQHLANPSRRGVLEPVLAHFGGLLIAAGKKLQERHMPAQGGLEGAASPTSQ
jgi:hypothetical protein